MQAYSGKKVNKQFHFQSPEVLSPLVLSIIMSAVLSKSHSQL